MKSSCLQENLNKAVSVVSRIVSTRGTLEILSHILLATDNGRLNLSATNLEIGINYKIGAKVEKEGSLTIPARLFSELISQLPEGKLDLEIKDETLMTKTGHYESQIKGLSAEDFPLIPKIKEKKLATIKSSELKEAINLVSFASAPDESRPVLAGIYFKIIKGKIILVATDSYRLAEKIIRNKDVNLEKEAIIPARSLMELARILEDPEQSVDIYLDDTQVMFETNDFEFTSRLVEGKFPDYKQIIPADYETRATLLEGEFTKIIKVVSLFSRESAGSITINIKQKGEVEAISSGSQYGESNAFCEARVEGKDVEIVFNSKYILDVLNNISDGDINLSVSGKLNPGVITKDSDKDYIYVIMPLRA